MALTCKVFLGLSVEGGWRVFVVDGRGVSDPGAVIVWMGLIVIAGAVVVEWLLCAITLSKRS